MLYRTDVRSHVLAVRQGDKFSYDYTRALKNQCHAIVLGDDIPLRTNYVGWWAKLELFAPWNDYLRPCLYVDLDTYLFKLPDLDLDGFWLIDDFNRPEWGESGVMWLPKDTSDIWGNRHNADLPKGDGHYLRQFPHQRLNTVIDLTSYKLHGQEGPRGDIMCFHGKPKPHETEGWAREYWRAKI